MTINAHPSSEENIQEEPGILTKGDFYSRTTPYGKFFQGTNSIAIYENLEVSENPEVNYFEQSSVSSSGIVEKCINNGYTPEEAVNIAQAKRIYGINESFFKNGVNILSTSCLDA